MDLPRHEWNKNIKRDLFEFLECANDSKASGYCNEEEYIRLKMLYPLSEDLKEEFRTYTLKRGSCIDITESEDDEVKNADDNINLNISTLSLANDNETNHCDDLIESIKDVLKSEKDVPAILLEDLQKVDTIGLAYAFKYFAVEFNAADIKCLWNSLCAHTNDDCLVRSFTHYLFLPKVKFEFNYDLNYVFSDLNEKYDAVFKDELVEELIQVEETDVEVTSILTQYITLLKNDSKEEILSHFIYKAGKLHPQYIPIIESLLIPQTSTSIFNKLVEIMATSASDFSTDNAYGKLLFKIINYFERAVPGLEQPLKHILGIHRSIWKIKVEKIVSHWFNYTLTQSFI